MSEVVKCENLTKRYGGLTALDQVSFTLESGRIIGLLGPNGSGKTTLIKLANGLLVPSDGKIYLGGFEPGVESKSIVSYLPDANYLPTWMNIQGLLEMFEDFYNDFDIEKAKEMVGTLNLSMNSRLKTLSKGNKEKVQLILAMSRKAKVYFLDEPIGGVDPAARDYILRTILTNYDENATILISTHLIADVENVLDEGVFIQNGTISLTSSVDDIRINQGKSVDALFREVFRC